jgi:hypothetical protein
MTTAQKYTKLKGLTLHVNYFDFLHRKEFRYSMDFGRRPSDTERYEFLMEVLEMTGSTISLIKPIK